ncbi:uncharacterized protein DUF664 [Jatrophihabitans sp. GAS493]|uniref:DinB family protein n=1 Tax=Jatrophihabitans sp. GAS493 TaxID=1907575 RepID=UPI000BC018D3|nr:DinB family protein [Jatrophihabitans sp. GAS493]SOD74809.1 uncharacterized protein DUF664 [Jatrophihabitans sp. GAS493]
MTDSTDSTGSAPSTWTAPTPPPLIDSPLVGAERPILEGFLAEQRHRLLSICAGLTGEQLAMRSVPPSNLSLLGLIRHMAKVERIWFRQRVAAEAVESPYAGSSDYDADFNELDPARAEEDYARLVEEFTLADRAAATAYLDSTFSHRGQLHSLRVVYVHMVEEYAQHNGHADLLRECIDGRTGLE